MTSVLHTQRPVLDLQSKIHHLKEELATAEKNLVPLIEAHRAQIARSLTSTNSEERQMAEGIATWWEVPMP